jgi:hypothetical protein
MVVAAGVMTCGLTVTPTGVVTVTPATAASITAASPVTFSVSQSKFGSVEITAACTGPAGSEIASLSSGPLGLNVVAPGFWSSSVLGVTFLNRGKNVSMIALTDAPKGQVDVSVRCLARCTVTPTLLSFTSSNWNQEQPATVTDAELSSDLSSVLMYKVAAAAQQPEYLEAGDVGIPLYFTNPALLLSASPADMTVAVSLPLTITVALSGVPSSAVTVSAALVDAAAAGLLRFEGLPLTLTTATPASFKIHFVKFKSLLSAAVAVSVSATGASYTGLSQVLTVVMYAPAIRLGTLPPSVVTVPFAAPGTVTVYLERKPSVSVTLTGAPLASSAAALTPPKLVFTSANYDAPQTWTVARTAAALAGDLGPVTFMVTPSGNNDEYPPEASSTSGLLYLQPAKVVVQPPADKSFSITAVRVTHFEPASFSVSLPVDPAADLGAVNCTLAASSASFQVAPTALSLTAASTPAWFTIYNINGPSTAGSVKIKCSGAGYDGVAGEVSGVATTATPGVRITGEPKRAVTLGPVPAVLGVFLEPGIAPLEPVMLYLLASPEGIVTVSPSTLNFGVTDFATPQPVSVNFVSEGTGTISFVGLGGYATVSGRTLPLFSGQAGISLRDPVYVTEGGYMYLDIRLKGMPLGDVVLGVDFPANDTLFLTSKSLEANITITPDVVAAASDGEPHAWATARLRRLAAPGSNSTVKVEAQDSGGYLGQRSTTNVIVVPLFPDSLNRTLACPGQCGTCDRAKRACVCALTTATTVSNTSASSNSTNTTIATPAAPATSPAASVDPAASTPTPLPSIAGPNSTNGAAPPPKAAPAAVVVSAGSSDRLQVDCARSPDGDKLKTLVNFVEVKISRTRIGTLRELDFAPFKTADGVRYIFKGPTSLPEGHIFVAMLVTSTHDKPLNPLPVFFGDPRPGDKVQTVIDPAASFYECLVVGVHATDTSHLYLEPKEVLDALFPDSDPDFHLSVDKAFAVPKSTTTTTITTPSSSEATKKVVVKAVTQSSTSKPDAVFSLAFTASECGMRANKPSRLLIGVLPQYAVKPGDPIPAPSTLALFDLVVSVEIEDKLANILAIVLISGLGLLCTLLLSIAIVAIINPRGTFRGKVKRAVWFSMQQITPTDEFLFGKSYAVERRRLARAAAVDKLKKVRAVLKADVAAGIDLADKYGWELDDDDDDDDVDDGAEEEELQQQQQQLLQQKQEQGAVAKDIAMFDDEGGLAVAREEGRVRAEASMKRGNSYQVAKKVDSSASPGVKQRAALLPGQTEDFYNADLEDEDDLEAQLRMIDMIETAKAPVDLDLESLIQQAKAVMDPSGVDPEVQAQQQRELHQKLLHEQQQAAKRGSFGRRPMVSRAMMESAPVVQTTVEDVKRSAEMATAAAAGLGSRPKRRRKGWATGEGASGVGVHPEEFVRLHTAERAHNLAAAVRLKIQLDEQRIADRRMDRAAYLAQAAAAGLGLNEYLKRKAMNLGDGVDDDSLFADARSRVQQQNRPKVPLRQLLREAGRAMVARSRALYRTLKDVNPLAYVFVVILQCVSTAFRAIKIFFNISSLHIALHRFDFPNLPSLPELHLAIKISVPYIGPFLASVMDAFARVLQKIDFFTSFEWCGGVVTLLVPYVLLVAAVLFRTLLGKDVLLRGGIAMNKYKIGAGWAKVLLINSLSKLIQIVILLIIRSLIEGLSRLTLSAFSATPTCSGLDKSAKEIGKYFTAICIGVFVVVNWTLFTGLPPSTFDYRRILADKEEADEAERERAAAAMTGAAATATAGTALGRFRARVGRGVRRVLSSLFVPYEYLLGLPRLFLMSLGVWVNGSVLSFQVRERAYLFDKNPDDSDDQQEESAKLTARSRALIWCAAPLGIFLTSFCDATNDPCIGNFTKPVPDPRSGRLLFEGSTLLKLHSPFWARAINFACHLAQYILTVFFLFLGKSWLILAIGATLIPETLVGIFDSVARVAITVNRLRKSKI